MSLGTGESPFKKIDPNKINKIKYFSESSEFMMNMETYTSDFGLMMTIKDPNKNYLRMQTVSSLKMDKIDPININGLKQDGENLYTRDEEKLKAILRLIIDDAFGPA